MCALRCSGARASSLRRLFTTPIYYVNASPHIGHLSSSLLTDALARYAALREDAYTPAFRLAPPEQAGRPAFSTGTDEHGIKIQRAAASAGVSPQQHCDAISAHFKQMHDEYGIEYTHFVRTTDAQHVRVVRWLWSRLQQRGALYTTQHEGWYCASEESFVPASQVCTREEYAERHGRPAPTGSSEMVAMEGGHAVEWVSEPNYYFRLSEWSEPLLRWLASSKHANVLADDGALRSQPPDASLPTSASIARVVPESHLASVRTFIEGGLHDISVSRARATVQWALPVPGDDTQSIYVWLDALANYLTAALAPEFVGDGELPQDVPPARLFPAWPADVHVVGKDIVRFHSVYWPAFCMAAGLEPPRRVCVHGHWTVDGVKMSKSLGNVVAPSQLIPPAGANTVDAVRYALLREGRLEGDSDFSASVLHQRARAECADVLGNLVTRCMSPQLLPSGRLPLVAAGFEPSADGMSVLSALKAGWNAGELELACSLDGAAREVLDAVDACDVASAAAAVMARLSHANRVFTASAPWKLKAKPLSSSASSSSAADAADAAAQARRLSSIMYLMLESLRCGGTLLLPVMPHACAALLGRLYGTGHGTAVGTVRAGTRRTLLQDCFVGGRLPTAYDLSVPPGADASLILFPKLK